MAIRFLHAYSHFLNFAGFVADWYFQISLLRVPAGSVFTTAVGIPSCIQNLLIALISSLITHCCLPVTLSAYITTWKLGINIMPEYSKMTSGSLNCAIKNASKKKIIRHVSTLFRTDIR